MDDAAAQTAAVICSALSEFYSVIPGADPERYTQLDHYLSKLHKSREGFEASFLLLNNEQASVQLFAACILYDVIRKRWEEYVVTQEMADRLKVTLIGKLTEGAHSQNQSVTNKLSSSLALLALHCMPDLWAEPIHDLTAHWAQQPELLLRVLAELAAEFPHVNLPLSQRGALKSTLLKSATDIIKVIEVVLRLEYVPPSLKNAAIECVEQWLSLPSIDLLEWQSVLIVVFTSASNDLGAVARILSAITCCENLNSLENFVFDFSNFIVKTICEPLEHQVRTAQSTGKLAEGDLIEMEELAAVVTAVADFSSASIRQLRKACTSRNDYSALSSICSFLCTFSTWPGHYPVDETVSEGPEVFWNSLKEELDTLQGVEKIQLFDLCRPHYAQLLQAAVEKVAYPPDKELQENYDKEQMEKLDQYRATRVEASVHAYSIVGQETCAFLCSELRNAIQAKSLCRIESILFLFERVADYLTEDDADYIIDVVEQCLVIRTWGLSDEPDESVLGNSLMNLLYAFSHLISSCSKATLLEEKCLGLVFTFLGNINVADEGLKTLQKFVEDRPPSLNTCADEVYFRCYDIFAHNNIPRLRLAAIKCVGYALSVKDPHYVLDQLDAILAPRLNTLQSVLDGHVPSSSQSYEELEKECLFELSVFSMLITSLSPKSDNLCAGAANTASFQVLQHCMPLFRGLIDKYSSSSALVSKVVDVLKAGISAMGEKLELLINDFYEIIDLILLRQPDYACNLAKAVLLTFEDSKTKTSLCGRLRMWYEAIRSACVEEVPEKYIELAYHVVRKNWKMLKDNSEDAVPLLRAIIELDVKVLITSQDPNVTRKSSALLAMILKDFVENDVFLELMQEVAHSVIAVTFSRLQVELTKSIVTSLADVLMYYARKYPQETRQYLSTLPNGNAMIDILKEAFMTRNFQQMVLKFNMTMRQNAA